MWCMPRCEFVELYDEKGDKFKVPSKGPRCIQEGRSFAAGANWVSNTVYRVLDTETAVTNSTGREVVDMCAGEGMLVTGVFAWWNAPQELPTEAGLGNAIVRVYYSSTNTEPVVETSLSCIEWCKWCQIQANGVTGALVAAEVFAISGQPIQNLCCWLPRPFLWTPDDRSRVIVEVTPSISVTLRANKNLFIGMCGYEIGGECGPYRGEPAIRKDIDCDTVSSRPDGSIRNQFVA